MAIIDNIGGNSQAQIDKLNESLGELNVETYTSFPQINETYTSANFMYGNMPKGAILQYSVNASVLDGAFTNGLIPTKSVGELVVFSGSSGRGHIEYHVHNGATYIANENIPNITTNSQIKWEKVALNSDLTDRPFYFCTLDYLSKLGLSLSNTLLEVIQALPSYGVFQIHVDYNDNVFQQSLPNITPAEITIYKGSSSRGYVVFRQNSDGSSWRNNYYNSKLMGWEMFATNSDLANYAKVQKGTGIVTIVSATQTPTQTTIPFLTSFERAPILLIDSKYREYIDIVSVDKNGFTVSGMNNSTSSLGNVNFTWVAIE